jgi:hypothetical protein
VAQHCADLRSTAARMAALADTLNRQAAVVEQEAVLRVLQGRE